MKVTFFIPNQPNLEELKALHPDRDWQTMRRGQRWVLQTYLRLARSGYPVEMSDRASVGGIVVFHAKHKHQLRKSLNGHVYWFS